MPHSSVMRVLDGRSLRNLIEYLHYGGPGHVFVSNPSAIEQRGLKTCITEECAMYNFVVFKLLLVPSI